MSEITLKLRIDELVMQHKCGFNKLARIVGIDRSYLSRLRRGLLTNPSDETLDRLGLERVISYRRKQ